MVSNKKMRKLDKLRADIEMQRKELSKAKMEYAASRDLTVKNNRTSDAANKTATLVKIVSYKVKRWMNSLLSESSKDIMNSIKQPVKIEKEENLEITKLQIAGTDLKPKKEQKDKGRYEIKVNIYYN